MMKKILPVVLVLSIFGGKAHSQWSSDSTKNTPVCIASNGQQNPQACSDGSNGIIVVWEDFRSGNNWDLYAQKLNADGVAQWTANGVNICSSTANQTSPVICSDGSGGAYVAWKDTRTLANGTDLYAQHIGSDGSLGYGASGQGIAVVKDAAIPTNLAICSDGNGNAYVAWEDSRSSLASNTRPDIWMNKLTSGGPAWGGNGGVSIISQGLRQTSPQLVSDGSGGCYLVWVNGGSLPASIWGTRLNANGTVLWGNGSGIQIFEGGVGTSDVSRNPMVSLDGSQLCVSWEQYNSFNTSKGWNILANRIKSDGSFVWGNSTVGAEISTDWVGDQINPLVFSDDSLGTGNVAGLLVVYEDFSGNHDVVMTRLLPDGNTLRPAFPSQEFSVCRENNDQTSPKAVKTTSGELLVVWNDTRSNASSSTYSSIYAQRVDKTPKRFIGPSPSGSSWGLAVSNRVGTNADEVELVARTNGGIAVWRDNRNGNYDIYAQLIFRDGSLPVEITDFNAMAETGGKVLLNWQTASEKDNAGFEVERRLISDPNASNAFEVVGSYLNNSSLLGAGFSGTTRNYAFIDVPGRSGIYEYRLSDYALDGTRTTHETKTVEVSDGTANAPFSVGQNLPNPFSDRTIIPITLSQTANVELVVTDVLGRVIATPFNSLLGSGAHEIVLNGSSFGQTSRSGAYYYAVTISSPETGAVIWRMPKATMMVKIGN
ncbi:MAG: hypothetical protein Q8916_14070 [Bacteroidota bacterium]|nr:hypothetical protein [Bacteroidota bacterium]MDP4231521.1 hypothetical protein [Bacteroidota bacterium]MDP4236652.1 hypothetical protein [Bacteroidota bacterium]